MERDRDRHSARDHEGPGRASAPALPTGRLRLRGRIGEVERTLSLRSGANSVGSSAANDVALPVRGVSRRHAVVRLADGRLSVEDQGSKNGTFVNGRPVGSCGLVPGDEVRFGPVSLVVEELAAEEAELGLELGGAGTFRPSDLTSRETTRLASEEAIPALGWLSLVQAVVERLSALPEPDVGGALSAVAEGLGLAGAALAEWDGEGPAAVVAAAGTVGELPRGREVRARLAAVRAAVAFSTAEGETAATWAAVVAAGRESLGLVLWGDFAGRAESEALLATLLCLFRRHLRQERARLPVDAPGEAPPLSFPAGYLPGEAPAMTALYQQLERVAPGDLPLLLTGETGVGKEPLARTLHASSARRRGPFVGVNCAAIPAELLEAEMFGVGRGVATGVTERAGKFQQAEGGTLFLDEIGDLPLALQGKLLRALQEREVQPLGRPVQTIDVRVVAATNRDLEAEVEAGRFRRDLYYRLAGLVLEVPPLRHRRQDLPRLIGHLLAAASREAGKSVRGITVKALRLLTDYPWPGNVRELEHEMRRLAFLCPEGEAIESRMLSASVLEPPEAGLDPDDLDLTARTDALARRLIRRALDRTGGNQSAAARLLGVSRNGLALRMKRLEIEA